MGNLYRKDDVVRDEQGRLVAVWMRKAWYERRGDEFVPAELPLCRRCAAACSPPETVDVSWKINLIDRLGVIRALHRTRT